MRVHLFELDILVGQLEGDVEVVGLDFGIVRGDFGALD